MVQLSGKQSQDATGVWAPAGSMTAGLVGACAAVLPDGRVLMTGGIGSTGALDSAELFTTNSAFSSVPPMAAARSGHTCLTLADGRVLVAGGTKETGPIAQAEMYDPARNHWASAGAMARARTGHSATLLADGRVLIAGGEGPSGTLDSLEIFDPDAATFRVLSNAALSSPRKDHAAALLPNGRVLIAGGLDGGHVLASADIFDPEGEQVLESVSLSSPRAGLSATALVDGRVLLAGGNDGRDDLATAEIYDPAGNRIVQLLRMTAARRHQLAFLLPHNQQVLLVGGDGARGSAELFTPWRGTFRPTGGLQEARAAAAGAPIGPDGVVVLAGGRNGGAVLETSRAYRFATLEAAEPESGAGVMLKGSGWQPGEKVSLRVQDLSQTSRDRTITAIADAAGGIAAAFQPQNRGAAAEFAATATGTASEARVLFANTAANLDQCGNLGPACDWINGNLGASKAEYFEGDSVPYRLRMTGLPAGSHSVTISWDTTKGGKHALDYLTTYNRMNKKLVAVNPCEGVSGCSGTPSTFPIPTDQGTLGMLPGRQQEPGQVFTLWGGNITGVSAYTLSGSYTGDSSTQITIDFTLAADQTSAVLAWGGHIATRVDWGQLNSAVTIPGSPYHTSLVALNGSGGNQDRSLSNQAVTFPASITIVKDANINGPTPFDFTTTGPSPLQGFRLFDNGTAGANTKLFSDITTFNTPYTVTEVADSAWKLDGIVCEVVGTDKVPAVSGYTVTITPEEGVNVTCTYSNSRKAATLIVKKIVNNDNGGTSVASDFTMTVTGTNVSPPATFPGSEEGTIVTIEPGTNYSVSETGPSGYTSTSSGCSGTIAAGATQICTFTNDDQPGTLIVQKVVVNNRGGSKVATDFSFQVNGGNPIGFLQNGDTLHGKNTLTVAAGTYNITEPAVSGYTGTYDNCANITVANGGSNTCTITNTNEAATLIVTKHVINDHGGQKVASDFMMRVSGGHPSQTSFAGNEAGTTITLDAGAYSVDEDAVAGYAKELGANCSGTIANGETKSCTITNNDQAATLTVIKHVVKDNGGQKSAGDFTINVTGTDVSQPSFPGNEAGTTVTLDAGSYSVDEVAVAGYTKSIGADCAGTIVNGESKSCTITNDDQPARLTVVKHVINDNGGQRQAGNFTINVTGTAVSQPSFAGSESGTEITLDANKPYSVDEAAAEDYTKTIGANCSGTLAEGGSATCTITNDDKPATLRILKVCAGVQSQVFTVSAGGQSKEVGCGGETSLQVSAGTHTVSETVPPGWNRPGPAPDYSLPYGWKAPGRIFCAGVATDSVTVANGETKTCAILNVQDACTPAFPPATN